MVSWTMPSCHTKAANTARMLSATEGLKASLTGWPLLRPLDLDLEDEDPDLGLEQDEDFRFKCCFLGTLEAGKAATEAAGKAVEAAAAVVGVVVSSVVFEADKVLLDPLISLGNSNSDLMDKDGEAEPSCELCDTSRVKLLIKLLVLLSLES